MADDAGAGGDRAVDELLLGERILLVAGQAQAARRIGDEHGAVVRAVGVVAAGAAALGDGGVDHGAVLERVAVAAELVGLVGELEVVVARLDGLVAGQALLLRGRAVHHLAVDEIGVAGVVGAGLGDGGGLGPGGGPGGRRLGASAASQRPRPVPTRQTQMNTASHRQTITGSTLGRITPTTTPPSPGSSDRHRTTENRQAGAHGSSRVMHGPSGRHELPKKVIARRVPKRPRKEATIRYGAAGGRSAAPGARPRPSPRFVDGAAARRPRTIPKGWNVRPWALPEIGGGSGPAGATGGAGQADDEGGAHADLALHVDLPAVLAPPGCS